LRRNHSEPLHGRYTTSPISSPCPPAPSVILPAICYARKAASISAPARPTRQARGRAPWRERQRAAGRRLDGGSIGECPPRKPWLLAAFRNPYSPSGGATIMAGCSFDPAPSAFLGAICHAPKAACFPVPSPPGQPGAGPGPWRERRLAARSS
jgi:hypothetical protein